MSRATEALTPRRRLLLAAIAAVMGAVGFLAGRELLRPSQVVTQPIAFNHQLHVQELEVECETCHPHYLTGQHSGLPTGEICIECHEEANGESAEEAKLVGLLTEGNPVEFNKLFKMPDHVYYSHRRHTAIAELECETCHGPVAETTSPPEQAFVRVTMDGCIDCHQQSGVQTSCVHCHR